MSRCTMDGCERDQLARGVCNAHYRQLRRRGLLSHKRQPECSVPGCDRPHKRLGLCGMHYQRAKTHGEPGPAERMIAPPGSSWRVGDYRMVYRPHHPLATKQGYVYVHRMVLFDAIGAGEHKCWNCDLMVSWERSYPGDRLALVVDHIDRDSNNNDVANLRASCQSCNTRRAKR